MSTTGDSGWSDDTGEPTAADDSFGSGEQRYRLDTRIATGGMGEVWRATDVVLGREVALKLLKAEYAGDPTFRSRFQTEARNAAALHHPNVASIFDFGELPGADGGSRRPYLVMELVRGEPLSALLRGGQPMLPHTAADLMAQAADGIAAAHDLGIVHRDVKPANLLVTPDRVVKITDFGIARAADAVALTQTGQVIGTPQYLSPEQAEGKQATAASDIYSLGVVLYECLAGRRPFEGDSPIATALAHLRQPPPPLPEDVPAQLRETVSVAMAKDPADRFVSVRDFATALRDGPVRAGAGAATVAHPAPVDGADDATRVQRPVSAVAPAAAVEPTADSAVPPRRDDRRRLPGWLPWLLAAAAVLALVWVLTRVTGGDRDPSSDAASPSPSAASTSAKPTTRPSPTRTRSSAPAQVDVVASQYVGRPADEAEDDLEGLGLEVERVTVDNPGGEEEDTVADVNPSGRVDPGSTVVLSVFDEAASETPETPTPSGSASPTTPASSPSDEDTPDPSPRDNGNGNENENGGGNGTGGGNGDGNGRADGAPAGQATPRAAPEEPEAGQ